MTRTYTETEEKIIDNWNDLYSQINYAYETQYCENLEIETDSQGYKFLNVYKLTIIDDGTMEYKGNITKYDKKLWPLVVLFAKLWNNKTVEVLYGRERKIPGVE